jgi:hypothetical protein
VQRITQPPQTAQFRQVLSAVLMAIARGEITPAEGAHIAADA